MIRISHLQYLSVLGVLCAAIWLALAVDPYERSTWLLENVLVVVFVALVAGTHRIFPLSRISYTLLFLFFCLHALGAHYTYMRVPYDAWSQQLIGLSLSDLFGLERNHFDRAIHFSYGLMLAYPIREIFIRIANVRGFWGYFLPLDLTMSSSMIYELIEWGAEVVFGGEASVDFLGTQGDPWDAHKDMALASLGALISMLLTAMINLTIQRDFAREWNDSLKVKGVEPLGEDSIIRMLHEADDDASKS